MKKQLTDCGEATCKGGACVGELPVEADLTDQGDTGGTEPADKDNGGGGDDGGCSASDNSAAPFSLILLLLVLLAIPVMAGRTRLPN